MLHLFHQFDDAGILGFQSLYHCEVIRNLVVIFNEGYHVLTLIHLGLNLTRGNHVKEGLLKAGLELILHIRRSINLIAL